MSSRSSGDRGEHTAELFQERGCAFALSHIDIDERSDLLRESDVGRQEKDRNFGFNLSHARSDLGPVHAGHGIVQHDSRDGLTGEDIDAFGAFEGADNVISGTLKQDASNLKADNFVIDAEHERIGRGPG